MKIFAKKNMGLVKSVMKRLENSLLTNPTAKLKINKAKTINISLLDKCFSPVIIIKASSMALIIRNSCT